VLRTARTHSEPQEPDPFSADELRAWREFCACTVPSPRSSPAGSTELTASPSPTTAF